MFFTINVSRLSVAVGIRWFCFVFGVSLASLGHVSHHRVLQFREFANVICILYRCVLLKNNLSGGQRSHHRGATYFHDQCLMLERIGWNLTLSVRVRCVIRFAWAC